MNRFARARSVILAGLDARAYPAAVVEVGNAHGPLWQEAFGRLTYADDAVATTLDTVFDLASLTKVISTASLAMRAVATGRLAPGTPIAQLLPSWSGTGRDRVTVRHLLDHSSGLPAHARIWETRPMSGRSTYERAIAAMPLEREPDAQSVYSDLGFMLLGFVLEDAGGAALDVQFEKFGLGLGEIMFRPPATLLPRIAPTEFDPSRGGLLVGEVHDENASALGGVAAQAGLFGTAAAVGTFGRLVLNTFHHQTALGEPSLMKTFAARTGVPGSSRALGWDTMLPTSSCGTRMSPTAIGHTGFTGTSLWIDWERDLYVVWLTNRVHPSRANEGLRALRPQLHDAILSEL